MQPNSCTKHIARVKSSQYIAQPLCEQTSKSNYSSCSSHTSYISHPKSLKVFQSVSMLHLVSTSFGTSSIRNSPRQTCPNCKCNNVLFCGAQWVILLKKIQYYPYFTKQISLILFLFPVCIVSILEGVEFFYYKFIRSCFFFWNFHIKKQPLRLKCIQVYSIFI